MISAAVAFRKLAAAWFLREERKVGCEDDI
jgi:hypothetical protein